VPLFQALEDLPVDVSADLGDNQRKFEQLCEGDIP